MPAHEVDLENLKSLQVKSGGRSLIAPCLECTFYFRHAPLDHLEDFFERALTALGDTVSHAQTKQTSGLSKISEKTEAYKATIFEPGRKKSHYWMWYQGCNRRGGVSSSSLEIFYKPESPKPEGQAEVLAAIEENRVHYEEEGWVVMPNVQEIRVSFDLDHELAEPQAMLNWVRQLKCVQECSFVSGHVGYSINPDHLVGKRELSNLVQTSMRDAFARHPGLGSGRRGGGLIMSLLKYWPGHAEFLPRFKRVQWLTFVNDLMLNELCGGREAVESELGQCDEVQCHDLGGGLMIQAYSAPRIGDVEKNDFLPAYRSVARVLAPARLPVCKGVGNIFTHEAAQAWLEALERPVRSSE